MLVKIRNVAVRTLHAFFPALASADDAFAARILPARELALYLRMDVRDRAHACLVARNVLRLAPNCSEHVLRAAFLHDVGKTVLPYNPLHRVLVHLHTPPGQPAAPLAGGLRGAWQVREHHERIGAEIIRAAGGDPLVAELVERLGNGAPDAAVRLLLRADGAT